MRGCKSDKGIPGKWERKGPEDKREVGEEMRLWAGRGGIGNGLLMSEEMTANVCSGGFYFLTH